MRGVSVTNYSVFQMGPDYIPLVEPDPVKILKPESQTNGVYPGQDNWRTRSNNRRVSLKRTVSYAVLD
jgi:hypothetical protein